MNQFNPIKELYDIYLEEKDIPRIVKIEDDGLGLDLDLEDGPVDPYLKL